MKQIDFLNSVRDQASAEYQNRIPVATRANLEDIYATILDDQDLIAEFYGIMAKVAKTIIHDLRYENPLGFVKGEDLPFGCLVEEMATDLLNAKVFDPEDCNLCVKTKAPFKAFYASRNRQDKYEVQTSYDQLRCAFTGNDGLSKLLTSIINKLYSSAQYDEYVITKEMFGSADVTEVNVPEIDGTADTIKTLVRAIKQYTSDLTFMKRDYNKAGFMVRTPLADQRLIIRKDIWVDIDVNYLAMLFNKDLAQFTQEVFVVDDFGSNSDCYAMIVDKDFMKIYNNLVTERSFEIGSNLTTSHWYHVWQTIMLSNFLNAVRFRREVEPTEVTVTSGTSLNLAVGAKSQIMITTAPANASYTNYTYVSSNTNVATVDEAGVVTAVGAGNATITLTNVENAKVTATVAVTVS